MNSREYRIERMRQVEREYHIALVALGILEQQLRQNPSDLGKFNLQPRDAQSLKTNLDSTYLIRIFAEFESGLREIWRRTRRRSSHPPMKTLLSALSAYRKIPTSVLRQADEVRNHRNVLVHEDMENPTTVTFEEAAPRLKRFFRYMPARW